MRAQFAERRVESIREQGKLDDALAAAIRAADSKSRLEDIYLPFRPKRRTKAEIAQEAGLEPLADLLLSSPQNDPHAAAGPFVDAGKNVADASTALDGARAIMVERFGEGDKPALPDDVSWSARLPGTHLSHPSSNRRSRIRA